jgi:hypothetical protein
MHDDQLSPDQRRDIAALVADFERQLARVGVDLGAAGSEMNELEAPKREPAEGDDLEESFTETFTVDVSGIVDTLRQLPDGAGTAAFIAAYNRTHPDWRERAASES